jgi:hypothetical protein
VGIGPDTMSSLEVLNSYVNKEVRIVHVGQARGQMLPP